MKNRLLVFLVALGSFFGWAQEHTAVNGKVVNAANGKAMENVNIVNINQVKGTITDSLGQFKIYAKANDTLHFSYLGFKSIKVRVTNDWIKFQNSTTIEMTELAFALEEVVITQLKLTGYLKVDMDQIPVNTNTRYQVSGLPSVGYEAGDKSPSAINKVLSSLFNPADFLHRMFGKKPNELKKLRKMKEDDEIRNLLAGRFDREMLMVLLQVDRVDLDEIVRQCNYSKEFIETANDLQILDAISGCYEEYKVLNRER